MHPRSTIIQRTLKTHTRYSMTVKVVVQPIIITCAKAKAKSCTNIRWNPRNDHAHQPSSKITTRIYYLWKSNNDTRFINKYVECQSLSHFSLLLYLSLCARVSRAFAEKHSVFVKDRRTVVEAQLLCAVCVLNSKDDGRLSHTLRFVTSSLLRSVIKDKLGGGL